MSQTSRILIADDNQANCELLDAYLADLDCEVDFAVDGQDTLDKVQSFQPDLILLDIMMPGMDGFEVCQKLSEDDGTKSIPVIFVTAQNSKAGKLEGLQAGAVDYITKPIDLDETAARVRAQLNYLAINQENVELTKRLGEARRAASIGALTQGIAHNLNNLLGVVMGYVELVKANHTDPEKVLRNINRVENAGNRIVNIIKQLSTIAFTTRLTLHKMPIAKLIDNAVQRANEACKQNFEVTIENPLQDKSIRTNIEAFEEALSNLIANAWESYTNSEKAERPVIVTVQLSDDEKAVQFEVVDQGSSIDPEVEDNMFEPFISTKQTVGVGMGLTIARHAIRTLGGEIYIKSCEEGGVAASFTHPYNKED